MHDHNDLPPSSAPTSDLPSSSVHLSSPAHSPDLLSSEEEVLQSLSFDPTQDLAVLISTDDDRASQCPDHTEESQPDEDSEEEEDDSMDSDEAVHLSQAIEDYAQRTMFVYRGKQ